MTQHARVLLILSDTEESCAIASELEAFGIETLSASDGITGIAAVGEHRPELVLCSRTLPKMGGLEVCKLIKRNHKLKHVPVLVLLDEGDDSAVVTSLEVGANDYLLRPLQMPELVAAVRSHLRHVTSITRLEDDNKELATILEIAELLTSTLSSSDLCRILVRKVAETLGVERCSLLRIDPAGHRASYEASTLSSDETRGSFSVEELPEVGRCIRAGKMSYVEDVRRDAELASVHGDANALAVLAAPLQARRATDGSLVFRLERTGEPFTYREIKFCQIVTTVAGNALENSALYESLEEAHVKLTEVARRDALTGVFNRRHLFERLQLEFDKLGRRESALACILIDVDHFKRINDELGHQCGDRVLIEIGLVLQDCVRGQDFVGRYGGEEFLVVLPETDSEGAVRVAERIRRDVSAKCSTGLDDRTVTVSVGVAVSTPQCEDVEPRDGLERLIGRADAALYEAKDGGRDRVIVSDDEPVAALPDAG